MSNFHKTSIYILIIVFFLLFGINNVSAATTRDVYVDPDASGTGDGTSWTNAYTSLFAAEAGEQGDITLATGSDEIVVIHCRSSAGTADTTAVTIDGWTTSATNYIKIVVDEADRHSGVWDESKYRLEANGGDALRLNGYVRVDGLQIYENDAVSGRNGIYINYVDVSEYHISNNIFYAMSGNGSYGIYNADADVTNLYIWNNIFYGGWFYGIYSTGGANAFLYNNTIDGCDDRGVSKGSGLMYARNNIVVDTVSGNDYHLVDGTPYSTNNISNNETAPGDNPISGKPAFVDEVGNNFHISASDTVALDAGTDLSADANLAFSTDIDGDTRSTWDIGADEYTVAVASSPVVGSFFAFKQSVPRPVISDVTVEIVNNTAVVKWETDKLATSEVHWSDKFYWLNRVKINRDFKTEHSVVLDVNIEKEIRYYFKVRSNDGYNAGFDHKLYSFVISGEEKVEDIDDEEEKNKVRISDINNLTVFNSDSSRLEINLEWTDSNPTSLVNSYSIYRNGLLLETTTSKSLIDSDISPLSYYSYYIVVNGKNNTRSKKSRVVSIISKDGGKEKTEETEINKIKENTEIDKVKKLLQKQIDSLVLLVEKLKNNLEE